MKKIPIFMTVLLSAALFLGNCREQKEEKDKGTLERAAGEAEDGVKRAGEEVKEAYKDVKEEVDGETDDN
ncbi:hypothetical protein [Maribacter sp. 2210JD10-5]|uniref:hypothetical protein n=1 Tax=Maribacter sp. 2210JD10-5 TaxID=3386272 RepID=UPI0039BD620E